MTVVVLGIMGRTPFAGVAWQVLHYLEGFRRLGYDVYYVEDTGEWPYDPEQNTITADCHYTLDYIGRLTARCGLSDRWAYRAASKDGRYFGLSEIQVSRLFERAGALINLTGATVLRDEHLRVPVRIYLETDPVLPQIEVAQGRKFTIDLLSAHTHHFTFGENFGASNCQIPLGRFSYLPTRQPVILDWWASPGSSFTEAMTNGRFTTIANWKQTSKDVEWNGELYTWSKHVQFQKFIDLPRRTPQTFELALALNDEASVRHLQASGWQVMDALKLTKEPLPYREYICHSRGEFTVAKDQYARLRSGWFSDRSACYLAAGRPVITQDTGFTTILPTGSGLFAFQTMDQILEALADIQANYQVHTKAAREIAREYFAAEKVIGSLMERAGL